MKTRNSNRPRYLPVLFLACLVLETRAIAQTQAGLGIQTYAGLTITGAVGTVYSIEYVTDLAQTNWNCLEFLQLPKSPFLWPDRSRSATGQRFYRAVEFPAPPNMVFIPPGTFRMGSPATESASSREKPQTAVTLTQGFWMWKHEVTQTEYQAVIGTNPSYWVGANRPVDNVSWSDATNYCARFTQQEQAARRIPRGSAYRLPAEAQWEYACRAWTSTRFSYGDDPVFLELGSYAWYGGNSPNGTQPVEQLLPNAWGLHDMQGNVWEWCQDWFSDTLSGGMVVDPQGPVSGTSRVTRGGAYAYQASDSRSASRSYSQTGWPAAGFRVVLVAGQP